MQFNNTFLITLTSLGASFVLYVTTLITFLADYSSFNKNVDFAGRMIYDDNGVEVFNFGKYKGMSVTDVLKRDPGYYSWILNSDFTLNTKAMLTKIRLRELTNK